jgi:hypothetical protein
MLQTPSVPGTPKHYAALLKLRLEIHANGQANAAVHFSTRQISTVNINYSPTTHRRTSTASHAVPQTSSYVPNGTNGVGGL